MKKFNPQKLHTLCSMGHFTLETKIKTAIACWDFYDLPNNKIIEYWRTLKEQNFSVGNFDDGRYAQPTKYRIIIPL